MRDPDLIIENVSGGGNRLDFGMLRYTDVAWMDDRSAPSVHVRHNVEGLSAAFPPAYLLSFVTEHGDEPLHNAADMALYFRSRMTAALGLCFRSGEFDAPDTSQIVREIEIYKDIRRNLRTASAALLTPQADAAQGPPWDVLQTIPTGNRDALISAFQGTREKRNHRQADWTATLHDLRGVVGRRRYDWHRDRRAIDGRRDLRPRLARQRRSRSAVEAAAPRRASRAVMAS
jgi:hypothetical protein